MARISQSLTTARILDPDNEYLRPILFYAENCTNLHVEGIHMKDSPVWHNFIVTCTCPSAAERVPSRP